MKIWLAYKTTTEESEFIEHVDVDAALNTWRVRSEYGEMPIALYIEGKDNAMVASPCSYGFLLDLSKALALAKEQSNVTVHNSHAV